MTARIEPAARPYDDDMEKTLERLMPPGVEPLVLFRTLARNPRVFRRFMAGGLLDKGTLSLREREIVIDRACARCGGEYEWGVHIAFFADRVGFGQAEIAATVAAGADSECWNARERLVVRLVDQLHDTNTVDDELWGALKAEFSDEQLLELIVLTGLYHMVSFVVNATRLPLEDYAARFPESVD
ncbi:MAG: carboxymuconolactone decarboxylase family protein [Parvibaculum sp.]|uniref:carboxymuconolactone decarboxylase family protein n=1 Tax=Parvibaculum sp. TaxID=2024848 RepID=UPI0027198E6D|nr:carboxymuconolactone decarboxylase family protein [Parvibaculum sp.]MDO8839878.1 carboxymuconolactone decarboxylase family protein [Parvibaculum sp.]